MYTEKRCEFMYNNFWNVTVYVIHWEKMRTLQKFS